MTASELAQEKKDILNMYAEAEALDMRSIRGPLTQRQVAEAADVPPAYVSRAENGEYVPAEALRRILGVYRALE